MSESTYQFLQIDLPPLLAAILASLACGLLGNYLVLRRQSLMGDAISHSVLPGLVVAFLVMGTRASLPMALGAAVAGVASTVLVELVRRLGRVENGAAMGVVFAVFFALGVLLIESESARQVDLDAECVLHGQLETLFWFPPREWGALLSWGTLAELPRQVWTLACAFALSLVFVTVLYKELRLASFDPGLSGALGFRPGLVNLLLMVLVAAATVASFEAVGSILVVAMLICPAATARLLTDRLKTQLWLSAVLAVLSAAGGYVAGALLPIWFGAANSLSASGMMTVLAGALLAGAVVLSPTHGLVGKALRRRAVAADVAMEDLLGVLYRAAEQGVAAGRSAVAATIGASGIHAIGTALKQSLVAERAGALELTDTGRARAAGVIRSHRLWESYLVSEAGLRSDHVHDTAMVLEHARTPGGGRIAPEVAVARDPHDRPIPE